MIAIVDYGLGNVTAIANMYKRLNIEAVLASTADDLRRADRLILPGVGSFDWAMQSLARSGLRGTLDELVINARRPVLGICVGMQMMAEKSAEGMEPGLGWIAASVERLPSRPGLMLPHMGWNDVSAVRHSTLINGLDIEARFYFLHGYCFVPKDESVTIATADYGQPFASVVQSGNVYGAQFHPEKSHGWGVRLLKNFAKA
ncbi:imidazole glycerol phosphate synthase subunit HisH [Methylosinus sp. PW1]|uniref:imidazole glycerol phosphate synthase subunit HisH n=1 Tax=Methylosinus sp. PW1 TaxID=107636 RepID=UPI000564A1B3|nr:imidazole glycerol phosphate synthase subunit HisH [Methylosinus sp. PW1]